MQSAKNVVPFLLLAACAPNSAVLESGKYVALFSEGTSLSLGKEEVDPTNAEFTHSYNLDCREWEDERTRRQLELEDGIPCGPLDPENENGGAVHEVWVNEAGFRVVSEDLEPWRGEAFIGAEGDLQIGFHHRLPGGADMRFIFTVDPDFQPTACEPTEDGGVVREPLDGDWIEAWSEELRYIADQDDEYQQAFTHMSDYLDDGQFFFLNATSYQINPRSVNDFWFLPDQFEAGAAQAKLSEELMIMRQSVWAFPWVYEELDDPTGDTYTQPPFNETALWWCDLEEGVNPNNASCLNSWYSDMDELEADVRLTSDEVAAEMRRMFRPVNGEDPIMEYRPVAHVNRWREPDGVPAGFDGWGELHYNYVVFSGDSNLEVGGRAEGAFSLSFEAIDSFSHMFLQGRFVIERIKRDRWVTADLRQLKAEENGVDLCFQQ